MPRDGEFGPATESKGFVFVSSCETVWGGSEELWWCAAISLLDAGHRVSVLKPWLDDAHPRVRELRARSAHVRDFPHVGSSRMWDVINSLLPERVQVNLHRRQVLRLLVSLARSRPALAVISQGENYRGAGIARACQLAGVRYVLISQKANDLDWPKDGLRPYVQRAFARAETAVFVSEHNRRLTEEQLDMSLPHARIVRNPYLAGRDGPLPWPTDELRLACVARLDTVEKGQDVLLRVLASDHWRHRGLRLSLFGAGFHREGLEGLSRRLGLTDVIFHGHVDDVESIWRSHHALILPSRAEGLPLALVEAMMCGRPAIVTDIGGSGEVIRDGHTGFLAESPTLPALDAALHRAWQARQEWPQLGINAARHIRGLVEADPGDTFARMLLAMTQG